MLFARRFMVRMMPWLVLSLVAGPVRSHAQAATAQLPVAPVASVVRYYNTDAERLAALDILLDVLELKLRSTTPGVTERRQEYRRVIAKLDPPRGADPRVVGAASRLLRDDDFRADVYVRFAPAFAPSIVRRAGAARESRQAASNAGVFWFCVALCVAASFASPAVVMAIGHRLKRTGDIVESLLPVQLPTELAVAQVMGQTMALNYDCGTILSIDEFYDETRPGGGAGSGMSTVRWTDGSSREVRTDWTPAEQRGVAGNRIRVTFETRDGRATSRCHELSDFGFRRGHVVGFVSVGQDILLAYNHADDQLSATQELQWVCRLNETGLRALMIVVAVLGLSAVMTIALRLLQPINPLLPGVTVAWMLLIAVLSIYYIRAFGAWGRSRRVRQFKQRCQPGLEAFLRLKRLPARAR